MYIFIGIGILIVILVFLLAEKFAPNSVMMVSFQGKQLKKFLIGLTIISTFCIAYGIYHKMTYKLPYIDITIDNEKYTVFGNIGELGYYSDALIKKGQETQMYIILWEDIHPADVRIFITYPSGKEEVWEPKMSLLTARSIQDLNQKFKIKEIYELSPYTFKESGNVKITLKNGANVIGSMPVKVKESK
ncbi:hypothetical protein CN326_22485 [Bacillus sp. AFS018417]|uniref:hypothetical protein n=1 Tax=Bacillus sp. AFS018417 TaxID=2033491 RepID=UPI000BF8FB91|nr:hypothetical protein [Bacillus sp. AFS018417]PEZ00666.1 hypothetical protein CN326_22485 [Bacillus sp. AFS018417]